MRSDANFATADSGYQKLLGRISEVYTTGQARAHQAVNTCITETYWHIGRDIIEFEQGGKVRADYGKALLASLSRDLTLRHGKGFSRDPFVFEFLKIPEPHAISETDLETRLCDHLQPFLLELGKGFTFVGRQYRIFVQKYQLYLPNREELRRELELTLQIAEEPLGTVSP